MALIMEPPVGDVDVLDIDPYSKESLSEPKRYAASIRDAGRAVWLPGYRAVVYSAGREDAVVYSLYATDDASALTVAREVAGIHAFELWDGLHMVSRHEPAL